MRPVEVEVKSEVRSLLPGADFADAFALVVDDPSLDAVKAAHRAMDRPPGWTQGLLRLRNLLVKPFGLITPGDVERTRVERIGAFPVLSKTAERVVLGLNDRHLDFRLAVDVIALDDRRREVVATTLVETHNLPGRVYLSVILPFHRRIVPSIMAQVARPTGN
jgi:hypothetical protein